MMVDVFHYLELRGQGLVKSHKYIQCQKVVKNLLEDVSAKPVHNLPCDFSGEPRATFLMDFSPNMMRVASTHGDHTVRVTDIRTGKCTHILAGHPRTPWCLAFNPTSNDILASGCLGGEIRIWDLLGGGSEVLHNPCAGQVITSLAFHPTGHVLVFATMNYIYFWDWGQSAPFSCTKTLHDYERIRWLRFDPFGQYLYTGIANNTTLHRDPASRVVPMMGEHSQDSEVVEERNHQLQLNRLRYQRLLHRFVAFQQERTQRFPAAVNIRPRASSPSPRSPVHEEGLDYARQYARHVTSTAGSSSTRDRWATPSASQVVSSLNIPSTSSSRGDGTAEDRFQLPAATPAFQDNEGYSLNEDRRNYSYELFNRRWGRYDPTFFSRRLSYGNNNNNASEDDNNNSNNNNFNFGNGSYSSYRPEVPVRLSSTTDRPFTDSSSVVDYLNTSWPRSASSRRGETAGSSAASSTHVPTFHGARNENAASESLDANEFEILPVDQVRQSQRRSSSTNNGSSSSGVSANADVTLAPATGWDDLRYLLSSLVNTSSEASSASSGAAPVTGVASVTLPSAASTAEGSESLSRTVGRNSDSRTFRHLPSESRAERGSGTGDSSNPILNLDVFLGAGNADNFEMPSARVASSSSHLTTHHFPSRTELPSEQEPASSRPRLPESSATSNLSSVHIHFNSGSWRRGQSSRHHSIDLPDSGDFQRHASLLDRSAPRHVIDQTSQTLGAMNLPESSDQCTDVSGLDQTGCSCPVPASHPRDSVSTDSHNSAESTHFDINKSNDCLLALASLSDCIQRSVSVIDSMHSSRANEPSNTPASLNDSNQRSVSVIDSMRSSRANETSNTPASLNDCVSVIDSMRSSRSNEPSNTPASLNDQPNCMSSSAVVSGPQLSDSGHRSEDSLYSFSSVSSNLNPSSLVSIQHAAVADHSGQCEPANVSGQQGAIAASMSPQPGTPLSRNNFTLIGDGGDCVGSTNLVVHLTSNRGSTDRSSCNPSADVSQVPALVITNPSEQISSMDTSIPPTPKTSSVSMTTSSTQAGLCHCALEGTELQPSQGSTSDLSLNPSTSHDCHIGASCPPVVGLRSLDRPGVSVQSSLTHRAPRDSHRLASDVRSGLRSLSDASQPSAFSIFSSRDSSGCRSSSLLNPASASPAGPSSLAQPVTPQSVEDSSTNTSSDATSDSQLTAVRDVQERLQQAVQQLREVQTSVRELTSTTPHHINLLRPDSVTEYLERRVSELDRRISDLEESYNSRIWELRHECLMRRIQTNRNRRRLMAGHSYIRRRGDPSVERDRERDRVLATHYNTRSELPTRSSTAQQSDGSGDAPPTRSGRLLECLVRRETTHPRPILRPREAIPSTITIQQAREDEDVGTHQRAWLALQQVHLHPDYSTSILDDTVNRPNESMQRLMNRTIAGAFLTRDDQAVANNLVPQTHRIQRWDVSKCVIPDITNASTNIVVKHCKLHNDASCDLSKDGTILATFVPSHRGFPDDNILGLFSLRKETLAQCLFTKSFGPNAISVSISPENRYILVGLAAKRLFFFTINQMVAQVYKLEKEKAGESSMKHVTDLFHPCNQDSRSHVSVNSARWLPGVGQGMVYGTNKGDLHFCRPGSRKVHERDSPKPRASGFESLARLHPTSLAHSSIATQTTTVSIRRSASTQTSFGDL
ncbi:activating molecule in BECN1-regulated autophagy protein 1-like [Physella acuta]|uniref:activating molecule in BECN1-regulated autophagy protein 1-like n=1 Tax=Physella acuta TaxID=109671 RepID=UPI0027DD506C|nr:activating molecule in BECN1-regulated autophagy protein 1-like [Physella acuta]